MLGVLHRQRVLKISAQLDSLDQLPTKDLVVGTKALERGAQVGSVESRRVDERGRTRVAVDVDVRLGVGVGVGVRVGGRVGVGGDGDGGRVIVERTVTVWASESHTRMVFRVRDPSKIIRSAYEKN